MKDTLGDRMKSFYENRTKTFLPKKTHTIIRIDGKEFHTYTKGLKRPFDEKLIADMNSTAAYLCENIQGANFAYTQSDEISILLTDTDNVTTDAWFDGNVQKIVSVSASLATAKFNQLRPDKIALFDSRVFVITSKVEVENYFIWRQQDCIRNSISSVAQKLYSAKQLHGKKTVDMLEMIKEKNLDWHDIDGGKKRGRLTVKVHYDKNGALRSTWKSIDAVDFTQQRESLSNLIGGDKNFIFPVDSFDGIDFDTKFKKKLI